METQSSVLSPQSSAMRLPRFWAVIRRRWPILVLLPLIALGLAAANYLRATKTYTASGGATITSTAPEATNPQGFDNYYRTLTSEAASDDLTRVVLGSRFAGDVAKRLQAKGQNDSAEMVQRALSSTRVHRVITINAATNNEKHSVIIAQTALEELVASAPSSLPNRPVEASIVDFPTTARASSLKTGVLAAGMVLAAVIAAAVIALLVDLFDTRLHDWRDVEDQLGQPVVGVIPRSGARAERVA